MSLLRCGPVRLGREEGSVDVDLRIGKTSRAMPPRSAWGRIAGNRYFSVCFSV